jgi:hypothetical protein
MKPRAPIRTAAAFKAGREHLGLNKVQCAKVFRLGTDQGRTTIRRIEAGQGPTGVQALVMEALLDGWRPKGVTLPIDGKDNHGS